VTEVRSDVSLLKFADVSKELDCMHFRCQTVTCCLLDFYTVNMKAVRSFETSVNSYQTAWRHIRQDSALLWDFAFILKARLQHLNMF
jgi:hypothetical protein